MEYKIVGSITVGCHTTVEADSPEEALKIAKERAEDDYVAELDSSGSYPEDEFFQPSNDGVPFDLEVEQ